MENQIVGLNINNLMTSNMEPKGKLKFLVDEMKRISKMAMYKPNLRKEKAYKEWDQELSVNMVKLMNEHNLKLDDVL